MMQARSLSLGAWAGVSNDQAANYCVAYLGPDRTTAQMVTCVNGIIAGTGPGPKPPGTPVTVPTIPTTPPITTMPTPGTIVTFPTTGAGFFAPGWYTTPLGLALIGGLALVGYKLYTRQKAA